MPYLYYFIYGVLKTNLEFLFLFTRENTIWKLSVLCPFQKLEYFKIFRVQKGIFVSTPLNIHIKFFEAILLFKGKRAKSIFQKPMRTYPDFWTLKIEKIVKFVLILKELMEQS